MPEQDRNPKPNRQMVVWLPHRSMLLLLQHHPGSWALWKEARLIRSQGVAQHGRSMELSGRGEASSKLQPPSRQLPAPCKSGFPHEHGATADRRGVGMVRSWSHWERKKHAPCSHCITPLPAVAGPCLQGKLEHDATWQGDGAAKTRRYRAAGPLSASLGMLCCTGDSLTAAPSSQTVVQLGGSYKRTIFMAVPLQLTIVTETVSQLFFIITSPMPPLLLPWPRQFSPS